MDSKHKIFLKKAIEISLVKICENAGGPFGAIIVREGIVLAEGWNKVTSTYDPTAHAEVIAIREACKRTRSFSLAGSILYTSCEPCPMCLAAAYWARVDEIYYANTREDAAAIGFDDQFLYDELAKPIQARALKIKKLFCEEAIIPFKTWENKLDKIHY